MLGRGRRRLLGLLRCCGCRLLLLYRWWLLRLAPSLKHGADLYGLFVFGGRDDETIHKCGQWPAGEVEERREDNQELLQDIQRCLISESEVVGRCQPTALRYHTMAAIRDI